MKLILTAILTALVVPSSALAREPHLASVDVPLRADRVLAGARPSVFNLVGLHWQGSGRVWFRTRSTGGTWSAWRVADPEAEDQPDAPERVFTGWRVGNPWWVGEANAIQYRLRGAVRRLRAHFVSSLARGVPPRTLSIAGSPAVIPRSAWGANESIRRAGPRYADGVRFSVVHHTAGSNAYTRAQSAAIVRAIQVYHVRSNGWDDIGYNLLVDKYGQVFEGRFGGVEQAVIGAHAEGFNTGSVGVALLGTYGGTKPSPAALTALQNVLAWRLDVAHVDPLSSLSWLSGGNARFRSGTAVPLRAVSGHRDTGFSACPGNALYRQLPFVARATAEIGLPKLYEPTVQGRPGGPVRFTARLSTSSPWTVTVTDAVGNNAATGRGEGSFVDWTWDATFVPPGRYSYTIQAGPEFRPATGTIGARPTALTLTGARASPQIFTPNGDSRADSTLIAYTLSTAATVTATLRDAFGVTLATLFVEQKQAGRHSFRFRATGIPDGRYTIALAARSPDGKDARAEVPVVVDRTLAAVAVTPSAVSPNGDGRNDELAVTFVLAAPVTATVKIVRGTRTVATVFSGPLAPGPQRLVWRQRVPDGRYIAVVDVSGPFGVRTQSSRFAVDTVKPQLRLLSAPALRFSTSEAGTAVFVSDRGRVEISVTAGRFTARGVSAQRFTAYVVDLAGNRSAVIRRP